MRQRRQREQGGQGGQGGEGFFGCCCTDTATHEVHDRVGTRAYLWEEELVSATQVLQDPLLRARNAATFREMHPRQAALKKTGSFSNPNSKRPGNDLLSPSSSFADLTSPTSKRSSPRVFFSEALDQDDPKPSQDDRLKEQNDPFGMAPKPAATQPQRGLVRRAIAEQEANSDQLTGMPPAPPDASEPPEPQPQWAQGKQFWGPSPSHADLKEELERRGLSSTGKTAELQERLAIAIAQDGDTGGPQPAAPTAQLAGTPQEAPHASEPNVPPQETAVAAPEGSGTQAARRDDGRGVRNLILGPDESPSHGGMSPLASPKSVATKADGEATFERGGSSPSAGPRTPEALPQEERIRMHETLALAQLREIFPEKDDGVLQKALTAAGGDIEKATAAIIGAGVATPDQSPAAGSHEDAIVAELEKVFPGSDPEYMRSVVREVGNDQHAAFERLLQQPAPQGEPKRTKASAKMRLSPVPEASVVQDDPAAPLLYTIVLERGPGRPTTLGIDGAAGGKDVVIAKIKEEGLLAEWNAAHPEQQVQAGDRIVAVNKIEEKQAMLQALQTDQVLELGLRRR